MTSPLYDRLVHKRQQETDEAQLEAGEARRDVVLEHIRILKAQKVVLNFNLSSAPSDDSSSSLYLLNSIYLKAVEEHLSGLESELEKLNNKTNKKD